jgi:hypothetical protein
MPAPAAGFFSVSIADECAQILYVTCGARRGVANNNESSAGAGDTDVEDISLISQKMERAVGDALRYNRRE